MYAPMILKKASKKYILEKMYNNFALYSDLETGIRECFSFHQLGMIEEMAEPYKKQYKEGIMFFKNEN